MSACGHASRLWASGGGSIDGLKLFNCTRVGDGGLYPTCRVILPPVSELHRGVIRMARSRSPWRALRPVLLAGAATLTWLTFSSTAASADTLSETSSLVGGVTSSVSAVSEKLVSSAQGNPSAPAAQSPGLLKPVVASVSDLADNVVASVPIVHKVVPAGTVTAVTAPVVEIADGTTSAVVEAVIPPVTEAVPVLEPVLDPVKDVISGATPVNVPALPGPATGEDTPSILDPVPVEQATATETELLGETTSSASSTESTSSTKPSAGGSAPDVGSALSATPGSDEGSAGTPVFPWQGFLAPSAQVDAPSSDDPSPRPGPAPAAPVVSGTGTGASSAGGSSGSAAWLNPYDYYLPLTVASYDGAFSQHVPAPVSFDPGSSPD